jgi:general nucleoside transport system ATP-binding protein
MRVELRHISKSFGSLRANDDLNLTFEGGHIYGLLGENGAGKSTLMKILAGFLSRDGGEILLNDCPVRIGSPSDALQSGIGLLQQDPLDFLPFDVLDNFLLGRSRGFAKGSKKAALQLRDMAEAFQFTFDPRTRLQTLTIGERQQLEIVSLLASGVEVLILDEPTTGISSTQKQILFNNLRVLAGEGRLIILVSHKLEDIRELCSRVFVLRRGKVVGREEAPLDMDRLISLMFGRLPSPQTGRKHCAGAAVLELSGFSLAENRMAITPLNLTVHQGEVIGLAGTAGSGRRLLLRGCAGLQKPLKGRIRLKGSDLTGQGYGKFRSSGVAYVPADRLEKGLIGGLTLTEHFLLSAENPSFLIDWRRARQAAASRIETFHITGQPETPVESLSGGNQQRSLLALLPEAPALLLMEHPTRGLDWEAARWVWDRLQERCDRGAAILFVSSDLDEIAEHSDAFLVFSGGQVSPLIRSGEAKGRELAEMIAGMGL